MIKYTAAKKLTASAVVALALTACGGSQAPQTLEEKQTLLSEYRDEMLTLKSQIEQLEAEIEKETGSELDSDLKRVTAVQVNYSTFAHYVEFPGDVRSNQDVLAAPEISGVVIRLRVKEGDYVRKGAVIAELDTEILDKQIEEVRTGLSLAKDLFAKQDRLWKQNIGSEVQYLQAKNNLETLERRLESLETQVKKGAVKAPISGTIDKIFPNKGEMAPAGQPLARILNLQQVEITAAVSEVYSNSVKEGDKVTVKFPMLGHEQELRVERVGRYINPANRSFEIGMVMNNTKANLKPNTMAMVRVMDYEKDGALVVPTRLVQHSTDGSTFVYILEKGKQVARKVNVVTGKSYKGNTVVEQGLYDGVMVIDKGYSEVLNGEEVKVVKDYSLVKK